MGLDVNLRGGASVVAMRFETSHERGEASEEFVWLVRDDKAALAGYSVKAREAGPGEIRA